MTSTPLTQIVADLYPLHRTLASEGTDQALELIGSYMPSTAQYTVERYTPGDSVWTWRVPPRYVVHEAFLETESGQRIADFADSPLHLVSYSQPVDALLEWEELESHLHTAPQRPTAIPWEFSYYEPAWGFCISQQQFDSLDRSDRYRAVIRSEFQGGTENGLRVGTALVHPEGGPNGRGEIIVCAHVCHPAQANDDAAGVATAVGVARRLSDQPLPRDSLSVRFLFCPESIGSICYLAHHEDLIPRLRGGVFSEMTGTSNPILFQRTRQDSHRLDRIARAVLTRRAAPFREAGFNELVGNDEKVINGPGVNIPCISISRWPYKEYHTSDDNMSIITEESLVEAAEVIEEMVRVFASDYTPLRTFRGPPFLSGSGLWLDWRTDKMLNDALHKMILCFEGDHTVFDIAEETGLDYWASRKYVDGFGAAGLVRRAGDEPDDQR